MQKKREIVTAPQMKEKLHELYHELGTHQAVGEKLGVPTNYISMVLSENYKGFPPAIASAMGFEKTIVYVEKKRG